jgi:hypothetical protein
MNKTELATMLNTTEETIEKHFSRLQKQQEKEGKILIKEGRGKKAEYFIKEKSVPTLYTNNSYVYLSDELISIPEFSMLVAIALATEENTFNAKSYAELLSFLDIKANAKNIRLIKNSLEYLDSIGLITYKEDTSDANWFIAAWSKQPRQQYKTQLQLFKICRDLSLQEHKSNKYIVYLIKTLIGIKVIEGQTITKDTFCNQFNLSVYQFDECTKILIKNNLINKELIQVKHNEDSCPLTLGTKYYNNGLKDSSTLIEK